MTTTPIGIDLGTTFSAIAYLDNEGRPTTVANSEGEMTTPSVVFFDRDAVIVGSEAAFAGEADVSRLARAAKRDMGGSKFRKSVLGRHLPPEVIQSFVLQKLKSDAELRLGEINKAVITVPAYFNEPRRKATQDAGELAGLEVIDIINEPTAAALAYGIQRGFLSEKGSALKRELVLVYDLGGGTFDVTLMEINENQFNTVATAGDVYLGGIDWDQRLYEYAKNQIETEHQVNFDEDPSFQEKLLNQCVRAKKSLSARLDTVIRVDNQGQRYSVPVTRTQFEELTEDLLERTRLTTEKLLRDANFDRAQLTRLILVGGSTRMPMVLTMLEKYSGVQIDRSLSPDEAVAHGAAIYAGILLKHGGSTLSGLSISNVNSHDLGVLGIDPDSRKPRRKVVIPRNHRLPAKATKRFQTFKDGQQTVVVQIVEGGTEEGLGATTIGKCVVSNLPAGLKKGTEVVVGFNYSTAGRLEITARIPSLRVSANSTIDRASGMTSADIADWKSKLSQGLDFLQAVPVEPTLQSPSQPPPTPRPSSKNQDGAQPAGLETASATKVKPVSSAGRSQQPPLQQPAKAAPNSNKEITKSPSSRTAKPTVPKSAPPAAKDPIEDFEVTEQSGIFVFGDEDPKPAVGASVLGILRQNSEAAEKSEINASALDFLNDEPKPTVAGESALDYFDAPSTNQASESDNALGDFLKDLRKD